MEGPGLGSQSASVKQLLMISGATSQAVVEELYCGGIRIPGGSPFRWLVADGRGLVTPLA